jgi:porin
MLRPTNACFSGLFTICHLAASEILEWVNIMVNGDFTITPAIRFIPGYQHIWDAIAARVSKHENGADVFLTRLTLAF